MSPTRYVAADGTRVEVVVMDITPRPGVVRVSPVPARGAQLRVTSPRGFILGYCQLAELGSYVDTSTLVPVEQGGGR